MCQPAGALDDLIALGLGELAEPLAALHAFFVFRNETLDTALQKADAFATVEQKPTADESLLTPARDRLGRYAKHPAQVLDGVDRFAGVLDAHIRRVRDVLDKQPQVMPRLVARNERMGSRLGTEIGDAIREIFVRIRTAGIQLVQ